MGLMGLVMKKGLSKILAKRSEELDEELDDEGNEKEERIKNAYRTVDQKKAAFYFSSENSEDNNPENKGCKKEKDEMVKIEAKEVPYFEDTPSKGCKPKAGATHYMSDQEYDALVQNMLSKINFKEKALEFLGVDESEVNEVDPIHFGNNVFNDDVRKKIGQDYIYRTSGWQETWLFFSQTSLFVYQCYLRTDSNDLIETNYEYSYKDITSITVIDETKEVITAEDGQRFKKTSYFKVIVPGDFINCSFRNNADQSNSIKAMRAYIREKKNAK